MTNPSLYHIRRAKKADQKVIRELIREARINILGLDWRRFYVAVDQDERVIGCGQIKLHTEGAKELASIVVNKAWQGRGVAKDIIENLIHSEEGDLWLMCRSTLVPFYERFGFNEIIEPHGMPPYFRRIKRLWSALVHVLGGKRALSIMLRDGKQ